MRAEIERLEALIARVSLDEGDRQRLLDGVKRVARAGAKLEFGLDRARKDQQVQFRLLTKTSDDLRASLAETEARVAVRTRELAIVADVAEAVATSLDREALLGLILDRMKLVADYVAATIYVPDADGFAALDYRGPVRRDAVLRRKVPLDAVREVWQAVVQGQPLVVGDIMAEEALRAMLARTAPRALETGRSWMWVPLALRGRANGLIILTHQPPDYYTPDRARAALAMARLMAIALENTRLFAEGLDRSRELARSVERLQALAEVSQAINATLDLDQVLDTIVAQAEGLAGSDGGAAYEFDQVAGVFTLRAARGIGEEVLDLLRAAPIRLGEGSLGTAGAARAPMQIPDLLADPTYSPRLRGAVERDGFRALLTVPLLREGHLLGGLAVYRRAPGAFPPEVVALLETFAHQSAVAIQNARLFREVEEQTRRAQEAQRAAIAANEAKSAFLANMSHELRTPLNAVLGFAQVMEADPALSARNREHLAIIARSGTHLLGLINDVLEMSKIEAGRATLNEGPFDLHALLQSVEEMFRLRAEAKGIHLRCERAPEVPRHAIGDEGKLRQVLINLLGNAVKFTHEGGVVLRAAYAADGRAGRLTVEVADSGEGIAPDQLPDLFQAFAQTASGRRATEGTGLGLAITRQFVELMGGQIGVTSAVGAGSNFRFAVPLALTATVASAGEAPGRRVLGIAPESRGEYRMLVVDDKAENRLLLAEWLRAAGIEVREAANGEEALAEWERWDPQLIWMDMRMPILDGYEATKRIKSTPRGQATVIIAQTASAMEHEQTSVLSAGCDDFVRKPVRESTIFAKISQHLGIRFLYEGETPAADTPDDAAGLSPAALAVLPAAVLDRLRRAAEEVDLELAQRVIDGIGAEHRALANRVQRLVDAYRFDTLQELLASDGGAT